MSNEEDREALARLVDPKAWREPILPETYRAVSRDESLMKADAILAAGFHRTPAPAPADSPPVYLALDLWMALGMPSNGFDGYYERNGWADTWANLLDAIRRQSGRKECPIIADGEGCVLINGHTGPHMGVSDVGSAEPLPLVGAAVSTPQDTEANEVLVEGSWFKRAELPTILANYMRSSDEYARQAKDAMVTLTELRSTVVSDDMVDTALRVLESREFEMSSVQDDMRAALTAALGVSE